MDLALKQSYAYCVKLTQNHYENFPVASIFLPKKMRNAIRAIYAFARTADDLADEGNMPAELRISQLNHLELQLHYIHTKQLAYLDNNLLALADTIEKFNLPIKLFNDLLCAFKQDVLKNRYENFNEILEYSQKSANPVGRILLHLTDNANNPSNLLMSDKICTALQFINMLQDFQQDLLERNRLYLPLNELLTFGLNSDTLLDKNNALNLKRYLFHACAQASKILDQGKNLPQSVSKLFGLEVKLIIRSAYTILEKIEQNTNINQRVKLSKLDIFKIFCKVIFNG